MAGWIIKKKTKKSQKGILGNQIGFSPPLIHLNSLFQYHEIAFNLERRFHAIVVSINSFITFNLHSNKTSEFCLSSFSKSRTNWTLYSDDQIESRSAIRIKSRMDPWLNFNWCEDWRSHSFAICEFISVIRSQSTLNCKEFDDPAVMEMSQLLGGKKIIRP